MNRARPRLPNRIFLATTATVLLAAGLAGCITAEEGLHGADGPRDCVWTEADARVVGKKLHDVESGLVATGPVWSDCNEGHAGCDVPREQIEVDLNRPAEVDVGAYVSLLDDPERYDRWRLTLKVDWSDWPEHAKRVGPTSMSDDYEGPGDREAEPLDIGRSRQRDDDRAMLYTTGEPWGQEDFPYTGTYRGTLSITLSHDVGKNQDLWTVCADAAQIPLEVYVQHY